MPGMGPGPGPGPGLAPRPPPRCRPAGARGATWAAERPATSQGINLPVREGAITRP